MNGSFFLGADRDRRLRRRPATINLAGHDVPGMRGLYAHVSPRMRDELIAALQARWKIAAGTSQHRPALPRPLA